MVRAAAAAPEGKPMTRRVTTFGTTWKVLENATLRLPTEIGIVVRVERGTVLVTQEGDLEDHVLEPGDELVLSRPGLAVAWAFTDAALSVHRPVRLMAA
jgi:DUF2917 family protein